MPLSTNIEDIKVKEKRIAVVLGFRKLADMIEENINFPVKNMYFVEPHSFYDVKEFAIAVKCLGICEKQWTDTDLLVTRTFGAVKIILFISREILGCTKKIIWDCPDLSFLKIVKDTGTEKGSDTV